MSAVPEKDHVGPPVELRLKLGTQEYAIEHTRIEAFEGEIERWVALECLVGLVEKAVCGKLPGPAIYNMSFPSDSVIRVSKSDLKKYQEILAEWVLETALHLYGKIQGRNEKQITGFHQGKALRFPTQNQIVLHDHRPSFCAGTRAFWSRPHGPRRFRSFDYAPAAAGAFSKDSEALVLQK